MCMVPILTFTFIHSTYAYILIVYIFFYLRQNVEEDRGNFTNCYRSCEYLLFNKYTSVPNLLDSLAT